MSVLMIGVITLIVAMALVKMADRQRAVRVRLRISRPRITRRR